MFVAGIDLGSSHLAACVLDTSGERPVFVDANTSDVGRDEMAPGVRVPLAPRWRHVLDEAEIDTAADGLVAWLVALGVRRAVIERPVRVYIPQGEADTVDGVRARAASIGTHLMLARALGEAIRARLVAAGIEVVCVTRTEVQREVVRARVKGAAPELAALLADMVDGWPSRSNEHERDAALACLVPWMREHVATPSRRKRGAGEAKAPRVKRTPEEARLARNAAQNARNAKKAAEKRAEKEAAGCTCKARHTRTCPRYVPMTYKPRANAPKRDERRTMAEWRALGALPTPAAAE